MPFANRLSPRLLNTLGFAFAAALIAFAYYLELVVGMEPCPLCIFQRVAVVAVAVVLGVAALHGPAVTGRRVYGVLALLTAGGGIALSLRHLWLQSLPADEVPACGPGLDYLMDVLPLFETIRTVLAGSGECAEVDRLFGVTLPAWTLGAFLLLGVVAVLANFRRAR